MCGWTRPGDAVRSASGSKQPGPQRQGQCGPAVSVHQSTAVQRSLNKPVSALYPPPGAR